MKRLISSLFLRHVATINVTREHYRETGNVKDDHADAVDDVEQGFEEIAQHNEGESENCHDKLLALMVNN